MATSDASHETLASGPVTPADETGRRSLQDALLYSLLRTATVTVRLFPPRWVIGAARHLGTLGSLLARRHRRRAFLSLDAIYGAGLSRSRKRRVVRGAFQSFAMTVVEGMLAPVWLRDDPSLVELVGASTAFRDWIAEGRPLLLLSGHLGSWELTCNAASNLGISMTVVMRPTRSRALSEWIRELRKESSQEVTGRRGALWALRRSIHRGRSVGLLIDQHDRKGIGVPFMGRMARTNPLIARIADRFKLPVFMGFVERVEPGRKYRLHVAGPVECSPTSSADERVLELTAKTTQILGGWAHQFPDQWFWLHRRWRYEDERIDYGEKRRHRRPVVTEGQPPAP